MLYDPKWEKKIDAIPGMDPDLKRKWLEALRSGTFPQTTGFFEDRKGFCALGVLCKTAGKKTLDKEGMGNWSVPNELIGHSVAWDICQLNDEGKSFPDIADYIEANL